MIRWHSNLYMDEKVATEPEKYMEQVENEDIHIFPVYCVTVASNNKKS